MMLDTTDTRTLKALAIAATADTWQRGCLHDGTKFYIVPSERTPHRVYWTNLHACTCPDFTRRQLPCKHMAAVALHVARIRADQRAQVAKPAKAAKAPAPVDLDTERQKRLSAQYAAIFGEEAA